jgi:glycine cleavage system H lipoate-binding protein
MVAILVLATFAVFVVVDFYFQRRKEKPLLVARMAEPQAEAGYPIDMVGGFKLPALLSYHPGHGWAMKEGPRLMRLGMDDFAARLLGEIDAIELPARGRWLRQGERGWTVVRGDHRFEVLSPIEGEVVDINGEILKDPRRLRADPYGVGWLLEVNSPAGDANLKNLLHGRLAQSWMEESIAVLYSEINGTTGVHLQDGGHAVDDVLIQVPEERWNKLACLFLLS